MNRVIIKLSSVVMALFLTLVTVAQVGINNPLPDASAVLDLSGGANVGKGLLLPQTTNVIGVPTPARGLLVFDSASNEVYIHNADSSKWYSMTPLRKEFGVNTIFVDENLELLSTLNVSGLSTFNNGINVTSNSYFDGNVKVDGAVLADTAAGTNGYFYGNGAVPPGVIVMWSGSVNDIPDGWGLCDGSWYTMGGAAYSTLPAFVIPGVIKSPDLSGRFIVGYDPADTDYNDVVTKVGGEKSHLLTADESGMPNHDHNVSVSTSGLQQRLYPSYDWNTSDGTFIKSGSDLGAKQDYISLSLTSNVTQNNNVALDASQPHENRPPYMTLAYIIKLKVSP